MASILTPSLAVRMHHRLIKIRELPIKGEITVVIDQVVKPETVIGRAELPGFLSVLRVSEALECSPDIAMKQLHQRGLVVGQCIKEGQLVASVTGLFGMFKREFKSPVTGVVEYIAEQYGHVGIRGVPEGVTLEAFVGGKVVSIDPGKSVTLAAEGAYLQGAFGVGGERRGVVKPLDVPPQQIAAAEAVPDQCSGAILYGGAAVTIEALRLAESRGAVGVVTGAISDVVLREYVGHEIGVAVTGDEKVAMTLMVTEGFGRIPISEAVLKVLRSCEGASAGISGVTQVRAGAVRPEFICERPGVDTAERQAVLAVGSRVRLIRVPYFGMFGEVVDLPHKLHDLATGAKARVARVRLDSSEVVIVPRANIELQL